MQFTFRFRQLKQKWSFTTGLVLIYRITRPHFVPIELHNHSASCSANLLCFNGSFHYIKNLSIVVYVHTDWTCIRLKMTPDMDLECERWVNKSTRISPNAIFDSLHP